MTHRLTQIQIEAFRGFNTERRIELDADFVLISGGNGLGKTSVVDAISWSLTGSLPHLKPRRRRQNDELVVNAYRAGELARVRLTIRLESGESLVATRTGNSSRSTLQLDGPGGRRAGDAAEIELAARLGYEAPSELRMAIETWAILRQDEVRAVLDASPDDIHRRLRDLLGLSVLDEFETDAEADYKRLVALAEEARSRIASAQAEVDQLGSELTGIDESQTAAAAGATARAHLERLMNAHRELLQLRTPGELAADVVRPLLADLRTVYSEATRMRGDLEDIDVRLRALSESAASEDTLRERKAARDTSTRRALDAHTAATEELERVRSAANQRTVLAAAALPLLDDTCPVCGQPIDPAQVRAHLTADSDAPMSNAIQDAEARLSEATTALTAAQAAAVAEEMSDQAVRRDLGERRRLLTRRQEIVKAVEEWATDLLTLTIGPDGLDQAISAATELGLAARQVLSALEAADAANRRSDVASRLSGANARLNDARRDAERLQLLVTDADATRRAARDASVEVTTRALQSLNPHFGQVYRRIDPHPTFTDLGLDHEVYRSRGRTLPVLIDPIAQVKANPGLICSIGQLNIVALSYFLALALLIDDARLPFAMFDDPLQSLDDVNVLGFADLCRQLRGSRQLIVTTHESRYAELLERKMAPREAPHSSIAVEFLSWDRSGPLLTQRRIEQQEIARLLTA